VKKIFSVIFGVIVLAGIASANGLVACGIAPIAFNQLLSGGTLSAGCEIGDYEYTNFAVSGGIGAIDTNAANVTATFALNNNGFNSTFNLNDANAFAENFVLTYTLTLDSTQPPASLQPAGVYEISRASSGLQDNGFGTDSATWNKQVFTSPGNVLLGNDLTTDTNGSSSSSGAVSFRQLVLNITDTYVVTNFTVGEGYILNLSNTYTQTAAEPSTMALFGIALIGLGVFARKHRKARA